MITTIKFCVCLTKILFIFFDVAMFAVTQFFKNIHYLSSPFSLSQASASFIISSLFCSCIRKCELPLISDCQVSCNSTTMQRKIYLVGLPPKISKFIVSIFLSISEISFAESLISPASKFSFNLEIFRLPGIGIK